MSTLSYSEIYGERKLATKHALARLNSFRNPLSPPSWAMPTVPTPLSIAYKAMCDKSVKEHEARTLDTTTIGPEEFMRAYEAWRDLYAAYLESRKLYTAVLDQAHAEAEEAYEAALEEETQAKVIYERELLLLILPTSDSTAVHYKILGPRNKVPTDTWMDAGLYGVSELGLRTDIRDVLHLECAKFLEADKTATEYAAYDDREPAGFYLIAAHKAHTRIKTILAESPRVGLWKATREAES